MSKQKCSRKGAAQARLQMSKKTALQTQNGDTHGKREYEALTQPQGDTVQGAVRPACFLKNQIPPYPFINLN